MTRRNVCTVTGTQQEKWRQIYGTESYGQLPQDKKQDDEGHCYAPCPFATQSTDIRTEHMVGSPPPYSKVDHTGDDGRVYNMKTWAHGSRWGFECTFSGCPYLLAEGEEYFWT